VTSAVRGGVLEHPGIRAALKTKLLSLKRTELNRQPSGSIPVSARKFWGCCVAMVAPEGAAVILGTGSLLRVQTDLGSGDGFTAIYESSPNDYAVAHLNILSISAGMQRHDLCRHASRFHANQDAVGWYLVG
jgi:hypothetical protein